MEFWGVEVKSDKPYEVDLSDGKVLHLSQACLGEIKNNKSSESVYLHVNVNDTKLVLGTLNTERLPQQLFDLVFDKNFSLSHNWKNGSVYFYGYKADQPSEEDDSEEIDTDEEEEAMGLPLPAINGKQKDKKEEKTVVPAKKDAGKQKVKIVEPVKDDDSDDDDSSDEGSDSDEDDDASDDNVEGSDEDEETPKKQISGKKRPNESSSKTPNTDKKAKMSTPQKTDGKKAGSHVATPHPSKKPGNTPATSKPNQKSPASAADGEFSCTPCNRKFKTDGALQSHNQAKHK